MFPNRAQISKEKSFMIKRVANACCHVIRQRAIFQEFYQFENHSKKQIYLRSLIKSSIPKTKLIPTIPLRRKMSTYSYYLSDEHGKTHQVCSHFLTNCLQINKSTVNRAADKIVSNPNAAEKRGQFRNKFTIIADISFLKTFIKKFPCHQSHYGPSNSNSIVKYLNPNLNIIKMYREYCLICQAMKQRVLSEWLFRNVFNTQFNLKFARLKVDTCKTCDTLTTRLKCFDASEHDKWQEEKKKHLELVQKYKSVFDKTIQDAKDSNENLGVLTFDLQRALELPRLTTSVAFYKRQLWFYNLCIYDEVHRIGYMYVWPESMASRGGQEIAACLIRHLRERLPVNTKKLILNSDSCYGQNKNIKLNLILKQFIDSWPHSDLKSVEQRYFVVGHSYNSCDRCFGLIENQKKRTEDIFTPTHWINVMRQAKKTDPKFIVTEMREKDFVSAKPLEALIVNRKKSTTGEKISWNNFQTIK